MLRRTLLVSPHRAAPVLVLAAAVALDRPARAQGDLWDVLRRDGIGLLRHATAPGVGDPRGFRLDDCATQRNLNETGRAEARQLGALFRENGVAVGQVLSSAWCRCLETARLLDLAPVAIAPALNSFFNDRDDAPRQTAELNDILENWSGPGALLCVTHQVNVLAIARVYPRSGETVVLGPAADGFRVAGTIPPPRI